MSMGGAAASWEIREEEGERRDTFADMWGLLTCDAKLESTYHVGPCPQIPPCITL